MPLTEEITGETGNEASIPTMPPRLVDARDAWNKNVPGNDRANVTGYGRELLDAAEASGNLKHILDAATAVLEETMQGSTLFARATKMQSRAQPAQTDPSPARGPGGMD